MRLKACCRRLPVLPGSATIGRSQRGNQPDGLKAERIGDRLGRFGYKTLDGVGQSVGPGLGRYVPGYPGQQIGIQHRELGHQSR